MTNNILTSKFIVLLVLISIIFISCDMNDPNDGDYNVNPRSGWIQFRDTLTSGQAFSNQEFDSIPYEVNVPVVDEELEVLYRVEEASSSEGSAPDSQLGEYTSTILKGNQQGFISIPLEQDIENNYTLSITLIGVNNPNIDAGITGTDRPTNFELTIICGAPQDRYFESTWNVSSTVCQGNGLGGCDPNNSDIPINYQVTMSPLDNPIEFELSDITGGLYSELYNASDNPAIVKENCSDELEVNMQPDVVFGGDEFNGIGTITLDENGNLIEFVINWSNNFGDAGTSTFTLEDE